MYTLFGCGNFLEAEFHSVCVHKPKVLLREPFLSSKSIVKSCSITRVLKSSSIDSTSIVRKVLTKVGSNTFVCL